MRQNTFELYISWFTICNHKFFGKNDSMHNYTYCLELITNERGAVFYLEINGIGTWSITGHFKMMGSFRFSARICDLGTRVTVYEYQSYCVHVCVWVFYWRIDLNDFSVNALLKTGFSDDERNEYVSKYVKYLTLFKTSQTCDTTMVISKWNDGKSVR